MPHVAVEGAVAHPHPAQTCTEPVEVSQRAILLHRALQTTSLPQHAKLLNVYAIPRSEVSFVDLTLHVRTRFPLQATAACQPLPHVSGLAVSECCGLIRLPWGLRPPCLAYRVYLPVFRLVVDK